MDLMALLFLMDLMLLVLALELTTELSLEWLSLTVLVCVGCCVILCMYVKLYDYPD
jgi:hypothetical protein